MLIEPVITNVKLSKNIIHLGTNAFNFCKALKTVDFNGAKVTSIGPNCFRDCEKAKFINMPNTVEYIGEAAFFNANVEEFDFFKITKTYKSINLGVEGFEPSTN